MCYYWQRPSGPVYTLYNDMLHQTHLLIAGATGSGKSTLINGIICTALHYSPDSVQFIMLDRKGVELDEYRRTPHCLMYAEEPRDMITALQAALQLMEARKAEAKAQHVKMYQGSDIYVIIDELADLMTTHKKQVTPLLQQLGQLARFTRIHMIACTQCPKSEIIPTPIKCNFPARVALKTSCRQDSRNIIDRGGAELLPDPPTDHIAHCIYMHGAVTELCKDLPSIPDAERDRLIKHWQTAHKHFSACPIQDRRP